LLVLIAHLVAGQLVVNLCSLLRGGCEAELTDCIGNLVRMQKRKLAADILYA
jgi:hypothetical protein